MKNINCICIVFVSLLSFSLQAQTKVWTLEECVKYAIDNNISIKQTELDMQNSVIDKKDALGRFLPSFNANATHSWNIGRNINLVTNVASTETTQYSSLGANASLDIYKGLQKQNTLRKAKLSIIASQYQLTKMQEDISLNVANAFLQVLFNKENLKVKQQQLAIDEKQYTRSNEMINAGTIPRGDLLDIKATLATDKQNIIAAENALLISKLSLAQLLQFKDFTDFDVIDATTIKDENGIMLQNPVDIYNRAKEIRTDLKIAAINLKIAEKNITLARASYQPSLTASYGFSTSASYINIPTGQLDANGNQIFVSPNSVLNQFSDNKGHNFGLQLSIPILNGLSVRNNVERSKVNLEKSKIDLEQKSLDLQRNVYTAFTDAKGALNTHESAIATLEARQQAVDYAKEKYDVGLMNSFDFNQAQTLLTNAQSEVLRTKYDYIFKIKILEFYFGIPITQN